MADIKKKIVKNMEGTVVSNKMDKTIVVKVDRVTIHKRYHKRYVISKKYKVHAEDSKKYEIGSKVEFQQCRPMSKQKRFRVVENNK